MSEPTPLMKQFWELKKQAGDALLLFRMGDFYELFGEDAKIAAPILNITLTTRDRNKENAIPMAGVPHHSAEGYIQKLLKAGMKVAIAEQVESPQEAAKRGNSKIVRREIVRTFTPAIQFHPENRDACYLATVMKNQKSQWILTCLDPSTGDALYGTPQKIDALLNDLKNLNVKHLLNLNQTLPAEVIGYCQNSKDILLENLPSNYLSFEKAQEVVKEQYRLSTLDSFFPESLSQFGMGLLITYSIRTQKKDRLDYLKLPYSLHSTNSLLLGPRAAQHLDLLPREEGIPNLYEFIDQTRSSMGSRLMKKWLLEPLACSDQIYSRQDGVRELGEKTQIQSQIEDLLSKVYDLERIIGRVHTRLANPRDTYALGESLSVVPKLVFHLKKTQSDFLKDRASILEEANSKVTDLVSWILKNQKADAPHIYRDAGIFEKGTSPELDQLIRLTDEGQKYLIDFESKEREKTKISNLKVKYNRVFGYYIEITKSNLKNVPQNYIRKQSTLNAERFYTEELKKFEEEMLSASEKRKALEEKIFLELLDRVQNHTSDISQIAAVLAEIDCINAFARFVDRPGWSFPKIDQSLELLITQGRHPLIDFPEKGTFVPNDLELSSSTQTSLLITGPNMGGKSTVMRQTALIIIMGQMGCPVPAQSAKWGLFTSIFTRIGAQDSISQGQSTFMVEMNELAYLLHHSDKRSLIILDEIGRGTSTYDGMSVAWATLEWITREIQARTLFSTHYHELTHLSESLPSLENAHMAVEESNDHAEDTLRFLYLLKKGPSSESFGIQVAKLAGIPNTVIQRAGEILGQLDQNHTTVTPKTAPIQKEPKESHSQLSFFTPTPLKVEPSFLKELKELNLDHTTPVQALNFLSKIKKGL